MRLSDKFLVFIVCELVFNMGVALVDSYDMEDFFEQFGLRVSVCMLVDLILFIVWCIGFVIQHS